MQSSTNNSDPPPQQQQQNNNSAKQNQQQPQQLGKMQHLHHPHPQWMAAMQYPAAMVMRHHMMPPHPQQYPLSPLPPQQYIPYPQYMHLQQQHQQQLQLQHQHQQQQVQQQQGGSNNGENKTIWIGDLHQWMDENYLHSCFASTGEVANVKVIRNKQTSLSEGYGFVEFVSNAAAENALKTYVNHNMPTLDQPFRLNWASFSMGDKRSDNGPDLSIFVGDLAPDVTDSLLHETFANKFPSVKAAKVVYDANSGRSKGYGFVRFGDDSERTQAMTEMNGVQCSTRPMRIGPATPRKSLGHQQYSQGGFASNGASFQPEGDSTNTTIFVGGLDPNVTDEDLRQPFSQHGEIVSIKIPVGKGCGFVQFANRNNAEEALEKLNGTVVGKQTVRLSWGRNPANKQMRSDFGNLWNGAYYRGGPVYDGYGYASPAHYGAYPIYGNQQQVS